MTYPNFSSKWKYLVLIIVCAIFLYFFTNYSMLRPSSPNARNKEYFIGLLLICVCTLNGFVLHPLLFQKNKTTAYVGYTVISLLAALVVEFTWLYSDIMGCILGNFTQKEAHHYYLGCRRFDSSIQDLPVTILASTATNDVSFSYQDSNCLCYRLSRKT